MKKNCISITLLLLSERIAMLAFMNLNVFMVCLIALRAESKNANGEALTVPQPKPSSKIEGVESIFAGDIKLPSSQNVDMLAASLSKSLKRRVLFVLPNNEALKAAISSIGHVGKAQWPEVQAALRQAGAMSMVFKDTDLFCVVQGISYIGADPKPDCYRRTLWQNFWSGYGKLSSKEKTALVSREHLYVPADLAGVPDGLKKVLKEGLSFEGRAPHSSARVQLSLNLVVNTAFVNPPKGSTSGWWKWSTEYDVGAIKFPSVIEFPTIREPEWMQRKLQLGSGVIAPDQITRELGRVTGMRIETGKGFQWPMVVVEGGDITVGQLLLCLKASTVLEIRLLQKEGLIYLTLPRPSQKIIGSPGMTPEEHDSFLSLLRSLEKIHDVDLGPLPFGILQIPTSSLPDAWSKPLLSAEPPFDAYTQIGIPVGTAMDAKKTDVAVDRWLKDYSVSTWVSLPSISLSMEYQEEKQFENGVKYWTHNSARDMQLVPTCE